MKREPSGRTRLGGRLIYFHVDRTYLHYSDVNFLNVKRRCRRAHLNRLVWLVILAVIRLTDATRNEDVCTWTLKLNLKNF